MSTQEARVHGGGADCQIPAQGWASPFLNHLTQINLERWRWLPKDLGERHIIVNIAGYDVRVIESDEIAMQMKAVVGRLYRETPVFTGIMTYLVFSPYWNLPPTIAGEDVLPEVQQDVEYLERQNMKVFQGWGAESR